MTADRIAAITIRNRPRYDRIQQWLVPVEHTIDPWALPRIVELVPTDDNPRIEVRVPYGSDLLERENDTLVAATQLLLQPLPLQMRYAAVYVALEEMRPAIDQTVRAGLDSLGQLADVLWQIRDEPVSARELRSRLALVVARAPLAGKVVIEGVAQEVAFACSQIAYALLEPDDNAAGARIADAVSSLLLARLDGWCVGATRPRVSQIRRELTRWWQRVQKRLAMRDMEDDHTGFLFLPVARRPG